MRFSHFFIDRPIFAAVLSIIITHRGAHRAARAADLGISGDRAADRQHPRDLSRRLRRGASPQTVATPIEQEVNGVDDMLYITSQSTGDGTLTINVVFKPGTNVDTAQVLVQNRVSVAEPRLPEDVQPARRHGAQGLARPDDGRAHDLARRLARPAIHLQLRDALHQGRAGARRRRRRRAGVRRARLLDARLARPRQGRRARPDRGRRGRGAAARPTCRSPRARSTSRPRPRRAPSSCRCRRWAG